MHHTLRAGLRVAGLMMLAIAVAHCGDGNSNNNDNVTNPTRTPTPAGATRTPTPTLTHSPGAVTITPTPGAVCPSAISFEGDPNVARLDAGWTGQSHASGVIDKGKVTVAVTGCASATRPCGVCNLSGPIANRDAGHGSANNQRCSGDTSIECTSDATCSAASAGTCKFFFGAPLALSAGGVSTCVVNEVNGTISGTANIETGNSASTVNLISRVFTGPTADTPCPKCIGDSTPEDGQRGGTCGDGARVGLACDVGGTHLNPYFGSTSFDCPPLSGGQIAALPITLGNATGNVTRTLSANNPECRGAPGSKCFCDTCNDLAAEPCTSNADCPASGGAPGVCGGKRCRLGPNAGKPCTANSECTPGACSVPGQPSAPNQCDDTVCSPTASDPNNGQCAAGPFEQFCGPNATFSGCTSDDQCAVFNRCVGGSNNGFVGCTGAAQCPGGTCEIQTCSVGKNRPCFLDNGMIGHGVTAVGHAEAPVGGVSHPTMAALFCIGPTSSGAVNAVAGLPGPGRLELGGTAIELQ